ncbi:MAG TPA: nuclear transport factor 2 family protein [Rubrivivax sp.]|nr:nuclear transport factor 2 family protein [Rubrivivax sp.]
MARPRVPPPAALLASPDDVEAQFYEALQHGDVDKLMAVWSDDDDIACVHPGGARLSGAAAIRASFEAIFAKGPVPLQPHGVRRLQALGCAVHHVSERIGLVDERGARSAWVLATNVYVKTAHGWRMVAHHASPGTAMAEPPPGEAPSTLH